MQMTTDDQSPVINVLADKKEHRLLEQQSQETSAKLADIEKSYVEELRRLKSRVCFNDPSNSYVDDCCS